MEDEMIGIPRPKVYTAFKIFQAGVGGTGGYLSLILSKFLYDLSNKRRFLIDYTLYDHDIVEAKNLKRQNFLPDDIGKYKSDVIATRYGIENYETCRLRPEYIEMDFISPSDGVNIILGCTDSIQFRLDTIRYLKTKSPDEMLWVFIDGGNLTMSGQVQIAHNLSPDNVYSENLEDIEKIFEEFSHTEEAEQDSGESCADLGDQTIGMNFTSALYIYNIVTEFLGTSIISCNFIGFRRYYTKFELDVNRAFENNSF